MKSLCRISLALVLALAGMPSFAAGSATSSMTVSANVNPNCLISAGSLGFGTYDPVSLHTAGPLLGEATINVTCTLGSTATVTLNEGGYSAGGSAAAPLRQMAAGSNRLAYFLFSEMTRTTVWGNTALTGKGHLGTGTAGTLTVYGLVPPGQNVPSGSYSDTVIATINF